MQAKRQGMTRRLVMTNVNAPYRHQMEVQELVNCL